jgi:perosamine synthetase
VTLQDNIYMAGTHVSSLEEEYVIDALRNGWYQDKYYYCERLQEEFSDYHDRKYALMTPNCTSAIHLVLMALGIGPGDEVIVPECTWIATASPVTYVGATPVFADIESETWCLDPVSLENSITDKTKAVIVVDLFGNMPKMDKIQQICDDNNLFLIEDAAEALGSSYQKTRAGKFGTASVFSFHNTKTMSTGEGGMLLLDNSDLYDLCVKLRDHGRGPNTKPYYNDIIGYKYMPFNIQAAMGLAQFHRLDELLEIKRGHLAFYKDQLSDLDVQLNHESDDVINGAWITGLVVGRSYGLSKHEIMSRMHQHGVPSRPFFYPLSSIPAFSQQPTYESKNVVSYDISHRGINLPGAPNLTERQLHLVCETVRKVLS